MSEAVLVGNPVLHGLMALGASSALAALSSLWRQPDLQLGPTEEAALGPHETTGPADLLQPGVTVELPFQGTVPSLYTLFFDDAAARALVAHLLRTAEAAPSTLGDSALCEVGNITACAFGDALARRTGMPWMPSVPTLRRGRLSPTNNPFILTSQVLTGQREPRGRLVWLLDRAHAFALSQVFEELPRSDLNGR